MQEFLVGGAAPIRHLERRQPWSVPISSTVTVVNEPPYRSFYIHGIFHSRFHLACPVDERYTLVMLIEAGHITQRRLAEAYGFDADTINNWVRRYREFGAAGLLRSNPSSLRPVPKVEAAACAQPSSIQQARLEPDQETTSATLQPLVTPAPPVAATGLVPRQRPETDCRETPIPVQEQSAVLDLLPVGQVAQTRYAGLLLALPFVQAALAQAFQYVTERQAQFHGFSRLWGVQEMLVGLALFFFAGIPNLEQTKALHRREFGVLLARRHSPSCRTLRRNLPWLTAGNLPEELRRLVARQLLALGWVEPGQW